jgi:quercetin dioxygenase-like cupin family protein
MQEKRCFVDLQSYLNISSTDDSPVKTLISDKVCKELNMGILVLEPGQRIPEEGSSTHEKNADFLLVAQGEVTIGVGDYREVVKQGNAVVVPKGTAHYAKNHTKKRAKIVWVVAPPME